MLRRRSRRTAATGVRDGTHAERVLITGASSGIGKATALHLAARGCDVFAASRRLARLNALCNEADANGLRIRCVELDVNDDSSAQRTTEALIAEHGGIDVLVNNAGFGLWGPVQVLLGDELRAQFETNFFAAVRMMQAVLPAMIERRHGTIVNISSVLGRLGTPFNGAYVSSKFALEGISESLRTEVAPFGVRVALVEPGLFRTDFHRNSVTAKAAAAGMAAYGANIERYRSRHKHFERMGGDPVRVARVVRRIIESPAPPFRNPVGLDAHAGTLGARLLPQRLYWWLMQRAVGS